MICVRLKQDFCIAITSNLIKATEIIQGTYQFPLPLVHILFHVLSFSPFFFLSLLRIIWRYCVPPEFLLSLFPKNKVKI